MSRAILEAIGSALTLHSAADLRMGTCQLCRLPPQVFLSLQPKVVVWPYLSSRSPSPWLPQGSSVPCSNSATSDTSPSFLPLCCCPSWSVRVWWGVKGGPVQIHLKCPLLLARPRPCLSSLSVWLVAPHGFPKSEELHVGPHYPAPLGSMGPKYGCVGIISAGPGSGHQAIGMGQAPLCCALGMV